MYAVIEVHSHSDYISYIINDKINRYNNIQDVLKNIGDDEKLHLIVDNKPKVEELFRFKKLVLQYDISTDDLLKLINNKNLHKLTPYIKNNFIGINFENIIINSEVYCLSNMMKINIIKNICIIIFTDMLINKEYYSTAISVINSCESASIILHGDVRYIDYFIKMMKFVDTPIKELYLGVMGYVELHEIINIGKFRYIKISCEHYINDDIKLDENNFTLTKIQSVGRNCNGVINKKIESGEIENLVNRNVDIKNRLHFVRTKAIVQ